MRHSKIKSADQIFSLFTKYRKSTVYKFRGQSDSSWNLTPKAGRSSLKNQDDFLLFKHWKRRAIAYIQKETLNDWELLAVANHYGLPTRLLDWSQNPLIALFFACIENFDTDGAVYVCRIKKYFDISKSGPFEIEKDSIHFIQPTASSLRLMNQLGYFSIHQDPSAALTDLSGFGILEKIIIPKDIKKEIGFILNHFGINNLMIYPDLEGLSKHLIWFYENYEYWDRTFPK